MTPRRDRFTGDDLQMAHIRLPRSLYEKMRYAANQNRHTLAEEVRAACEEYVSRQNNEQRKEQVEKHMIKRATIDPTDAEMVVVSIPFDQWTDFSCACLIRGLNAEEQLDTLMRDFARTVKREETTLGGVLEERR